MSKIKHMYGSERGGGEGRAEEGGRDGNSSWASQRQFFCASLMTSLFLKENKNKTKLFLFNLEQGNTSPKTRLQHTQCFRLQSKQLSNIRDKTLYYQPKTLSNTCTTALTYRRTLSSKRGYFTIPTIVFLHFCCSSGSDSEQGTGHILFYSCCQPGLLR